MTPPIPRAHVRAMLEAHVSRHAQACLEGRGNAVKLDIDDELNDAYAFIYERAGALAAEQFKRMYAEEELAFMLDLQADPQAMRRRILPNQPPPSVVVQSQLPGPKKGGAGALSSSSLSCSSSVCSQPSVNPLDFFLLKNQT